jgi:ligand-binding sensor domain-containing protein/serine phosphatase RsbU (regulator of sigma subunit)
MRYRLWISVEFVLLIFIWLQPANAQYYKFQQYGVSKGICYPFVYQVSQDNNGFIWAMTGAGICRFDGFNFKSSFPDSLPETSATAVYKKDNLLWVGYSSGLVMNYNGKKFIKLEPDSMQSGSINGIISDSKGNILVATQSSGLIIIDKDLKRKFIREPFSGRLIYSLCLITENVLAVGTDDGILLYNYNGNTFKLIKQIEGLPLSKVQSIVNGIKPGLFWVSTEDAGLYAVQMNRDKNYKIIDFGKKIGLQTDNVQSVFFDKQKNLWISTFGKGVFKVKTENDTIIQSIVNFHIANGLSSNDIKGVFQDREGNIWISTFGNGICMMFTENFIAYDFSSFLKSKNVSAVCFDKDGYWVGGEHGVLKVIQGIKKETRYFGTSNGLPDDAVTALYLSPQRDLYIGTSSNGVYIIKYGENKASSFLKKENSIANAINAITGNAKVIYISTDDGIYQYDFEKKTFLHHSTDEGQRLSHNSIRQVFLDKKNAAWIATQSSMLFTLNTNDRFVSKGAHELEFIAITDGANGDIWAGTNGNGVFNFSKDSVIHYSTANNLKSDYCYAMATDNIGNIWVGHRLGLSRINSISHNIKIYGSEFVTGDINPNAISVNNDGQILFGTTDGLLYYESSLTDKTPIAPKVNVTSITLDDIEYDLFSEKIVLPYGRHRLKIEFIGLSYSNPEQVTYKYQVEGYDTTWTETKEPFARLILDDGFYTIHIKARNGDGVWSNEDMSFIVKVKKPFWKTWWFFASVIIFMFFGVYAIIRIREKKQKEFQEYLEKLLDERTREVREQKEEIESKNRDITDSINYAQRIQASILPSLRKLQHYFTGSFVYYQPRDIVSGDFYFFEMLPNTNKFIVVCADSTGHGVPGAFMSLIGTTLLKDIFNRPDVSKPSDILNYLDKELKSTLNQNLDGERPNDGMDIIVCEIDIVTYKVCFASAMRPFIVYQNGEQLYYKGSRSSIGGQMKEEKIFEDIELQLTKGDLIYMFSDGYPDQFGGSHGKKFKMVRLRNLLKDIYQKPMEEQYNYVKSNFDLWRGDLEQVDDVIFMGIKI